MEEGSSNSIVLPLVGIFVMRQVFQKFSFFFLQQNKFHLQSYLWSIVFIWHINESHCTIISSNLFNSIHLIFSRRLKRKHLICE